MPVSDGRLQSTQAEYRTLFCSRAMLICSIIWLGKADVAGCCSAGSVLVDMRVALSVVSLICIGSSCFCC